MIEGKNEEKKKAIKEKLTSDKLGEKKEDNIQEEKAGKERKIK